MPGRGNALSSMKHRITPVGGTGPKRSRKERIARIARATKIINQNVKKSTNHNADFKRQQLKQKLDKKY